MPGQKKGRKEGQGGKKEGREGGREVRKEERKEDGGRSNVLQQVTVSLWKGLSCRVEKEGMWILAWRQEDGFQASAL